MNYLELDQMKTKATVNELNILLASYNVYYQNLRNYHWNLTGKNFFELHEKFEELYNDAKIKIDEIAERILTLRFRPTSNFSNYLMDTVVAEGGEVEDDVAMVTNVLLNHKQMIKVMRNIIRLANEAEDEGTIDLMGGFLKELEKKSWMLDAWLAGRYASVLA